MGDFANFLALLMSTRPQQEDQEPPLVLPAVPRTEFLPRVGAELVGGALGTVPAVGKLLTEPLGESSAVHEFFGTKVKQAHELGRELFGVTEPPDTLGDHIAQFLGVVASGVLPMTAASKAVRALGSMELLQRIGVKAPTVARSLQSLAEGFAATTVLEEPELKDVAFGIALDWAVRSYRVARLLQPGKEKLPIWDFARGRWARLSDIDPKDPMFVLRGVLSEADLTRMRLSPREVAAAFVESPLVRSMWRDVLERSSAVIKDGPEWALELQYPTGRRLKLVLGSRSSVAAAMGHLYDGAEISAIQVPKGKVTVLRDLFAVQDPAELATIVKASVKDSQTSTPVVTLVSHKGESVEVVVGSAQWKKRAAEARNGRWDVAKVRVPEHYTDQELAALARTLTKDIYGPRIAGIDDQGFPIPISPDVKSYALWYDPTKRMLVRTSLDDVPESSGAVLRAVRLSLDDYADPLKRAALVQKLGPRASALRTPAVESPSTQAPEAQAPTAAAAQPQAAGAQAQATEAQARAATQGVKVANELATLGLNGEAVAAVARFAGKLAPEAFDGLGLELKEGVTPYFAVRLADKSTRLVVASNAPPESVVHELTHAALYRMDKGARGRMLKELRAAIDASEELKARIASSMSKNPALATYVVDSELYGAERTVWLVRMAAEDPELAPIVEKYMGDRAAFGGTPAGALKPEEIELAVGGIKVKPDVDMLAGVRVSSTVVGTGDEELKKLAPEGAVVVSIPAKSKAELMEKLKTVLGLGDQVELELKRGLVLINGKELPGAAYKGGKHPSVTAALEVLVTVGVANGVKVTGDELFGFVHRVAVRNLASFIGKALGSTRLEPTVKRELLHRLESFKGVTLSFDDNGELLAIKVADGELAGAVKKVLAELNVTQELLVTPGSYPHAVLRFLDEAFAVHGEWAPGKRAYELLEQSGELDVGAAVGKLSAAREGEVKGLVAVVTNAEGQRRTDWLLISPGGRRVHLVTEGLFESQEYSTFPREVRELLEIGYDVHSVVTQVADPMERVLQRFEFALRKNVVMAPGIAEHPAAMSSFYEDARAKGFLVRLRVGEGKLSLIEEDTGKAHVFTKAEDALEFLRQAPVKGEQPMDKVASTIIDGELAQALGKLMRKVEEPDAMAPAQVNMLVAWRNRLRDAKDAIGATLASTFMFARAATETVTKAVRKRIIEELQFNVEERKLPFALYQELDKASAAASSRSAQEIAELVSLIHKVVPTEEDRKRITLAMLHFVGVPDEKLTPIELSSKRAFMEANASSWRPEYDELISELRATYKRYFEELMQHAPEDAADNLNEIFAYVTKLYSERSLGSTTILGADDLEFARTARKALQERERMLSRFQLEQSLLPIDRVIARYVAEKNYLIHVKPVLKQVYDAASEYREYARLLYEQGNKVAASVADSAASLLNHIGDQASGRVIPDSLLSSAIANVLEESGVDKKALVHVLGTLHTMAYANTLGLRTSSVFRNFLSSVVITLPVVGPKHYSAGVSMWKQFLSGSLAEYKHPVFMSFLKEYDDAKATAIRLLRTDTPRARELAEVFADKTLVGMRLSERHIRGISFFAGVSWARAILSELKPVSTLTPKARLWLERETLLGFFLPEARKHLISTLEQVLQGSLSPIEFERAVGKELVRNTMWAYGPLEVPKALRSPVSRLLFMYHTWPANYALYLSQLFSRRALTSPYMRRAALRFLTTHIVGYYSLAMLGVNPSSLFFTSPVTDYQGGPALSVLLDLADMVRMRGNERPLALSRFVKSSLSAFVVPAGSAVREHTRALHLLARGDYVDSLRALTGTPMSVIGRENIRRKRELQTELLEFLLPESLVSGARPVARYVW